MSYSAPLLVVGLLAVASGCSAAPDVRQTPAASSDETSAYNSPITVGSLLSGLRSASPAVRTQAAAQLAAPGPRMPERVGALAAMLSDPDDRAGQTAAWALGRLGAEAVPALVSALADHRPAVRARAIYALGEIGPGAAQAGPQVRAALADADRAVREMATWSIGRIERGGVGGNGPALGSIADLTAGLASPDPLVRMNAIQRHQPFASGEVRASISPLIRVLSDPDPRVRAAAADALVWLGPAARSALTAALSDSNAARRREAAIALIRLSRSGL